MQKQINIIYTLFLLSNLCYAQQTIEETLLHESELRQYTIYIPSNYTGENMVPLLFNFHGGAGDIASQLAISDMRPLAEQDGFIVVYPQALEDPNDGGSTNWTHKQPTTHDDTRYVDAMIEKISAEYFIDYKRVYACGYSNGGEFCFELACRLSDKIAAIGVVARSMYIDTYNECSPTHPTAVMTIHGTKDDYEGISWLGTLYYVSLEDTNQYWATFNNTDPAPITNQLPDLNTNDETTVERFTWENGDACVSVEHLKVIDGGHDWPGTFGNMDIDASDEIWNFVSKHDLTGRIDCTTSIDDAYANELELLKVYPNPFKDHLIVTRKKDIPVNYEIITIDGQVFSKGFLTKEESTVNTSLLPPNLYLLRIGSSINKILKTK